MAKGERGEEGGAVRSVCFEKREGVEEGGGEVGTGKIALETRFATERFCKRAENLSVVVKDLQKGRKSFGSSERFAKGQKIFR